MRSIRARLFVGLSVLVLGTNIGFGLPAYRRAGEEVTELQDAVLRHVGRFAVTAGASGIGLTDGPDEPEFRGVIAPLGAVRAGSPLDGVATDIPDGISTIRTGSARWRLLIRTRVSVTALPPTSPRVVATILMTRSPRVTAGTVPGPRFVPRACRIGPPAVGPHPVDLIPCPVPRTPSSIR